MLRSAIEGAKAADQHRFCRAMYDRLKRNGDLAKAIELHLSPHLDTPRAAPQFLWHAQEVCRSPDSYFQGTYGADGLNSLPRAWIANAVQEVCAEADRSESTWGKIP